MVKRHREKGKITQITSVLRSVFRAIAVRISGFKKSFSSVKIIPTKYPTLEAANLAYSSVKLPVAPKSIEVHPVERSHPFVSSMVQSTGTYSKWGWLPEIALWQSMNLLLIAWAFVEARTGNPRSETFFWVGLGSLIVPVAIRLYSTEASRPERVGLLLLLGGFFYLVKVMHSPYAFTFPDEFSNLRNVQEILENQRLFQENPDLRVTALYPGLATITSFLVSLGGFPPFPAGLLVIGAARLVLFLALFLLYEQVSGSERIGSLATLFYTANANFLFYTAEFSYESLALPMAIFVLYITARREMTNDHRFALTVVALLGIVMVVISHHMTSFVLVGLLLAATAISIMWTRGAKKGPWDLALAAVLTTSLWVMYVATFTIKYLSPVFGRTGRSIVRIAAQEETTRELFKSNSTGYVSPLWEQFAVLGAFLLISLGLPVGWWKLWRQYRYHIFALLLGVVSLVYLPMQALRLTSAGWETANRSSEFLFIGVGFVLAFAIAQIQGFRFEWIRSETKWIPGAIIVVLFFGGFISGWPPQARMPRPYLVDAGSHTVEPQIVEVARWAHDYLGPDHRIATTKVGAKLFSAYGEQAPFTGKPYGIKDMLQSKFVGPSELEILRGAGIEFIASERRSISWDHMIGLFFVNHRSSPAYELGEFKQYQKFDGLEGVHRILDSGDIIIYDVRIYLEAPLEGNRQFDDSN
jgi:hypothetical protein